MLTLDSLYDDAMRRNNQTVSYNPWEPAPMSNPMMQQTVGYHDPFYASSAMSAPHSVQMAGMTNQHQGFMFNQQQQQQQMMMGAQQPANPFANPYPTSVHQAYGSGMPVQTYNPYNTGLI